MNRAKLRGKSGLVELPKYVRRVTKPNGKAYTLFIKHRNTPQAWPAIALPDPLTRDFAVRYEICLALDYNGNFTLGGKRLPPNTDATFWRIADEAYRAYKARGHAAQKDFTGLTSAFESPDNPKWLALSASTRRGYLRSGAMIRAAWGSELPADLTAIDAQEAIDALGDTPATANQFRAYLSRLMSWGILRGFCSHNPIDATEKIAGGIPWKPWPEWAFDTLIEHAPLYLLMPAVSALFTGQRQGDVIAMPRPRLTDHAIPVRAQKTKKTVWIPIHSEYAKWIAAVPPAAAIQLHLGAQGRPYASADSFRSEWQRLMDKPAFARFRAERIVFHGLRKNAVINLLEAGCTEAQAGSICNMTPQMVQHYGREVSMRALARDAMAKMESRWGEVGGQFGFGDRK